MRERRSLELQLSHALAEIDHLKSVVPLESQKFQPSEGMIHEAAAPFEKNTATPSSSWPSSYPTVMPSSWRVCTRAPQKIRPIYGTVASCSTSLSSSSQNSCGVTQAASTAKGNLAVPISVDLAGAPRWQVAAQTLSVPVAALALSCR